VKAVGGKKSNFKSRNLNSENQNNQSRTPSRLTASDYKTQISLNEEIYFPKDRFKKFVSVTYNDWYYDRNSNWDYDELIQLLQDNPLDMDFGPYLAERDGNILTQENMPFIDLGDKPTSYNPNRPESDQMFMIPKSQLPKKLIVKYSFWANTYEKSLKKKYKKTLFNERGLEFDEFKTSLSTATKHM